MAADTWTVPCGDALGRPRAMTAHVVEGRVLLHLPPGESAAFAGTHLLLLRHVLGEVEDSARRDADRRARRQLGRSR